VSLRLGIGADADGFGYAMDLGLPIPIAGPPPSMFNSDPIIKAESVWSGSLLRPGTLLSERRGTTVRVRGDDG
jgi:predicted ATPase